MPLCGVSGQDIDFVGAGDGGGVRAVAAPAVPRSPLLTLRAQPLNYDKYDIRRFIGALLRQHVPIGDWYVRGRPGGR